MCQYFPGNYSKSSFAPHMSPKQERSFDKNDEDDVDVEQWSDSEDQKPGSRSPASLTSEQTNKHSPSSAAPSDGEPPKKKKKEEKPKFLKPKCNSEELLGVDCYLETKELWDKFNELGTEMIITKTGR